MDASIERLLLELEAAFDAAVTKDEEAAATDLARGFDRGLPLRERLCRSGTGLVVLTPGGGHLEVASVAEDYFSCGDPEFVLGRLDRVAFALDLNGSPPRVARSCFAQALRRWSESAPWIEVGTAAGGLSGRLVLAGSDHLLLDSEAGRMVLPLAAVDAVRLARGG